MVDDFTGSQVSDTGFASQQLEDGRRLSVTYVTDICHGSQGVSSIMFKPFDSDPLVSGSFDQTIKLWHVLSCEATMHAHRYVSVLGSMTFHSL